MKPTENEDFAIDRLDSWKIQLPISQRDAI